MAIFCQNGINLFIFVMEMIYVFWEFGTELVNILLMNFFFLGGGVTHLSCWETSLSNAI